MLALCNTDTVMDSIINLIVAASLVEIGLAVVLILFGTFVLLRLARFRGII